MLFDGVFGETIGQWRLFCDLFFLYLTVGVDHLSTEECSN